MKKRFGGTDRDNRGMSLIEIIIVVAIMSTMIGVISFGLSLVSGRPAEECAQKLASVIQHTRTITMGKNMTTITIYMDADGRIAAREVSERILDNDGNVAVDEKITIVGDKGVEVVCHVAGGGETEITGSNTLELSFDRGSGALQTTKINGAVSGNCTMIVISKANKTRYIVITSVTGKLSIQNTP